MPSVNDPHHSDLENDVTDRFAQCGFVTENLTYHDKCDHSDLLRGNHCKTALIVRHRADRISHNAQQSDCIIWDAKTSGWPTGKDFAIDVVPFFSMCNDELLGACCRLFCRRRDGESFVVSPGYLSGCLKQVLIPNKMYHEHLREFWRDWIGWNLRRYMFSTVPILPGDVSNDASGDPFCVFDVNKKGLQLQSFDEYFAELQEIAPA